MKGEELFDYQSVQSWFESLEQSAVTRGKSGLSKTAKSMRLGRMLEFIEFTNLNPDELLAEAKEDIDIAGQKLLEYFKQKQKTVSFNSSLTSLCYLRGFYTHNDLVFPKKWGVPKKEVSKVSTRDTKTSFYKYNDQNGEVEFRNGNLQHFVQNLSFRDQTITLCLLSSGADATDLLSLNVGFVRDDRGKIVEDKRIFWHGNRAKTGEEFKTFFSEEATQFLKRYVEQERSQAKDDEPLFVGKSCNYTFKSGPRAGEKVVVGERLTAQSLSLNFRESAQKLGYAKKKGQTSPFRPKRFRHLFRTACAIAQIDGGYTRAMMGHASDVSSSYLSQDSSIFEKMYVKVEPLLTVFGVNQAVVNEMTKEVGELKAEQTTFKDTQKILAEKVKELEIQLESAQGYLKQFEEIIDKGELTKFREWMEQHYENEGKEEVQEQRAQINKEHPVPEKPK